jgi:hypothetical protein
MTTSSTAAPSRTPWQVRVLRAHEQVAHRGHEALVVGVFTATMSALAFRSQPGISVALIVGVATVPALLSRAARASINRRLTAGTGAHLVAPLISSTLRQHPALLDQLAAKLRISPPHPAFLPLANALGLDTPGFLLRYISVRPHLSAPGTAVLLAHADHTLAAANDTKVAVVPLNLGRVLAIRTHPDTTPNQRLAALRFLEPGFLPQLFRTDPADGGLTVEEAAQLAREVVTKPLHTSSLLSAEQLGAMLRPVLYPVSESTDLLANLASAPLTTEHGLETSPASRLAEFTAAFATTAPLPLWHTPYAQLFQKDTSFWQRVDKDRPAVCRTRAAINASLAEPCGNCSTTAQPLDTLWAVLTTFVDEWDDDLTSLTRLAHTIACTDPAPIADAAHRRETAENL